MQLRWYRVRVGIWQRAHGLINGFRGVFRNSAAFKKHFLNSHIASVILHEIMTLESFAPFRILKREFSHRRRSHLSCLSVSLWGDWLCLLFEAPLRLMLQNRPQLANAFDVRLSLIFLVIVFE